MPETTENYHRIPVSSGHSDHDIKTITVSSERGIKALYCVDCKKIITYLFDVDKWTMDEAKEWVEDHKDDSFESEDILDKDAESERGSSKNMNKNFDRRTKDRIGSAVRYKSYGPHFVQKSIDNDGNSQLFVRGFFTSDEMDEVGDIITKDATQKAIDRWRRWGNIRTMHDYPSGRVEAIGEKDGLEWNEIITVPVDQGTKDLIEGGVLKAYSVGIIPREYELNEPAMEERGDDPWFFPLIIHEYDMVEISYVDHPANYSATFNDVSTAGEKEFSHRAVLFKNSEIMKEVDDMEMNDAEVLDDTVEDVVEQVEESDQVEQEASDGVDEVEDVSVGEPEEYDIDSDEEALEKGEEEGFDIELAVQDLKGQITQLEERVAGVADYIAESLADSVAERILNAMKESSDVEPEMEPVAEEAEKSIDVDLIVEKVIAGLAEILVPVATRSASITVDEQETPEVVDSVAKTKKYMNMPREERRGALVEVLKESYGSK